MQTAPMRFGLFLAPFHPVTENPQLALERDFQLIEHMDRLGYDEAWIGEHHSAGYEIIPSPEIFIAGAAERTRRIKLGTGVVSLPYHHPFMVADRAMQLDHQLRGRFMLGVGPGALSSDAMMMGIDPMRQREMMEESLDVIVPLIAGEKVTARTDWFELCDARVQLTPFTHPRMEIAVAAMISPAGPALAGKHGAGLLSIGATTDAGYMALSQAWSICEDEARKHGQSVDRANWRLVGPMHIAETREQAIANVRFGLMNWAYYYTQVIALPFKIPDTFEARVQTLIDTGWAVIGTPDDAIAQIERLQEQSGGAGAFLFMANNWADFPQTLRSYELFARYVIPHFNRGNVGRKASMDWVTSNRGTMLQAGKAAKEKAAKDYAADKARGNA